MKPINIIPSAFIVLLLVLFSCEAEQGGTYFKSVNGRLLDANGNEFVMRGVNVPHAWHYKQSYDALDVIAQKNANSVRIVWESHLSPKGLDSILQKSIDLKMIPMVELHDATGDSTATSLIKLARYFVSEEMQAIYRKYKRYLLVNIANEWGSHSVSGPYWKDAYKECIHILRNAGYVSTIVIDAPGWGQNIEPILSYGKELIEADPMQNILFSVHMYGSWNSAEKIRNDLSEAKAKQIPLIVGEFGYNYNDGNNNLNCKVDHAEILATCKRLNMGYLAWSWTGNNEENNWLDLAEYNDWKTLSTWGREVFNAPNGIVQTAKKASIFND